MHPDTQLGAACAAGARAAPAQEVRVTASEKAKRAPILRIGFSLTRPVLSTATGS